MTTTVHGSHAPGDASVATTAFAARVARGAVGGVVAGAAFIVATMWFATSVGDPARGPLLMISTIVQGDGAMADGSAEAGVGLVVHTVLSAAFGVLFALVAPLFRTNGTIAAAGAAYGALLYLVNFKLIAPVAFEIFEMANQPFELVVHVAFGTVLAFFLYSGDSRSREPVLAVGRR